MTGKIIDVSVHQGDIDWTKVKSDSVEFAILRAGYGREASQKYAQFEKNYAGCKANAVVKGDSLWAISEQFLGNGNRYPELKEFNALTSNTIYPGQILKIPPQ